MSTSTETIIEGEVIRITFENAMTGYRVLKVNVSGRFEPLAVVGILPPVHIGGRVRAHGMIVVDPKFGEQLQAVGLTELAPNTRKGIANYLGSGLIPGVGAATAQRIVDTFGDATLKVLDETPERLREVGRLGAKRIASIAGAWNDQRAVREVMVFLQAHGASTSLATRIWKRYGSRSIHVVSSDPYRLAIEVKGVGFKTADKIAQSIGIASDSPRRIEAGVLHIVGETADVGHTFIPKGELIERAAAMLGLPADRSFDFAISELRAAGLIVVEATSDSSDFTEGDIVFARELHEAEERAAKQIVALSAARAEPLGNAAAAIAAFEAKSKMPLAVQQRAAIEAVAESPVVVITGGPGVGKTTIVRALVDIFSRAGLTMALAAPTGRAAKRMADATGREAMTLHRLLEFDPKSSTFKRSAARPIEVGALIVDESSMIDLPMFDALTQAIASGVRLVLVGDVDQLPSVGPGAVLHDVIASRAVPCVRLTQIFRQAAESMIVRNAHRVHSGEIPVGADAAEDGADFFVIERDDPEAARDVIIDLVTRRIPRKFGFEPVRDIQVLTPMHRGPCGAIALNDALQAVLNSEGASVSKGERTLRVGDKVMQLRNDYDRAVWNGDLGVITSIDGAERSMTIGFETAGDEARQVSYDAKAFDDVALAYACTVHKSQGSEYPAVVIPLLSSHFVMLSRKLLYTAITRGKRLVVLVVDRRALPLAVGEVKNAERYTRMARRIERARAGHFIES